MKKLFYRNCRKEGHVKWDYKTPMKKKTQNHSKSIDVVVKSNHEALILTIGDMYCKLGHISIECMEVPRKLEKLHDLHVVDISLCERCVNGKHKKASFSITRRSPI